MASSGLIDSGDQDPRVEDYLNDRIQSTQDLQNLDDILRALHEQHELQRKQLGEAEGILEQALKASTSHNAKVKEMADAFEQQQHDIEQQLLTVAESHATDEAVVKFQSWMQKIQTFEIAKGYMEILKEVEELRQEALSHLKDTPELAIPPYRRLWGICNGLREAQPAAEGAASHLVDRAEQLRTQLRESLEKNFGDRLRSALSNLKWPGPKLELSDESLDEMEFAFHLLLELQEPQLATSPRDAQETSSEWEPPILLPLEIMVHPLELRFKYHFTGDRPTNRLDKPEYFLAHVLDLLESKREFFVSYIQPLFDSRAAQTGSTVAWAYFDCISSLITALLPLLRQKLAAILPPTSEHPQLLSHLMHELMKFDDEIRNTWDYTPDPYSGESWKGLTWEVLVKGGWFPRWLNVEKEFALSRYQEIIDAPDSGELDYDSVEPNTTKPTKAAIRVNDLLETITDRYKPLASFSQKLRFLIDIQISIFDMFHIRLREGLEAYLAMTSTIGRTVQGSSGSQGSLEGVHGLERLCRIFGSAEYLEKKMQDWSDDVFFLELWTELQERAKRSKRTDQPVAGPMTVSDVAKKTSNAVSSDDVEGALFDETASAYGNLRTSSERIIVTALINNVHAAFKEYSRLSTWASLSQPSTDQSLPAAPTPELAPVMRTMSTELDFLAKALSAAPFIKIARQLLGAIQTYLWDNILLRNSFTAPGASQFAVDVQAICAACDQAVFLQFGGDQAARHMRHVIEGLLLLGLPLEAEKSKGPDSEPPTGLVDVERKIFESNESAREMLRTLKLENLTVTEARSIINRRIDLPK